MLSEWNQPWIKLPNQVGHAMLVIEPNMLGEKEIKELLLWVKQGNELLLFQKNAINISTITVEKYNSLDTGSNSIYLNASREISFIGNVASVNRIKPDPTLTILLEDDQGIVAAQTKHGQGSIIVFVTPEWLRNDAILESSHFELVWNSLLTLPDKVWVDEYHHGIQTKPGWLAVYPNWLLIIYGQLLLVLWLWLWQRGKRFGAVTLPREWVVRRGDETLLAVAHWYQRTGSHKAALQTQERYLRQSMQERWGLRTTAQPAEVIAVAQQRLESSQAGNVEKILLRLEQINRNEAYSAKQFVLDSHLIAEIVQAIERE